jgi:hypothetical protein
VFNNILNNACKYTEPGGKIWLTFERQGSDVVVSIRDTGVGIPPDKLSSVFEMFTQIERTLERSQGGLGIGLTLVKRLVEMHDGTVMAQSEGPGRGSEFVVRLPVLIEKPEAVRGGERPTAEPTSTTACRILVVDDNTDAATSLALLLKITGNETETAYDGREAVLAFYFRFDCLHSLHLSFPIHDQRLMRALIIRFAGPSVERSVSCAGGWLTGTTAGLCLYFVAVAEGVNRYAEGFCQSHHGCPAGQALPLLMVA